MGNMIRIIAVLLLGSAFTGCTNESPTPENKSGVVKNPAAKSQPVQAAVNPGSTQEKIEAGPTVVTALPSGDWSVSPPKGCQLGTAKMGAGGMAKAKMKASLTARTHLAQMIQGLVRGINGGSIDTPTIEERTDGKGRKTRVVTTTTSNVNLVGVRMVKSKVAGHEFTAMLCLDPADVIASFRNINGLSESQQAALLAQAQKEYGGLAASLAALESKPSVQVQ